MSALAQSNSRKISTSDMVATDASAVAPGATDPGLVDLPTGKVAKTVTLADIGATSSPAYQLTLNYSSAGLYAAATTWNYQSQAIETGLGWNSPALHQRIVRQMKGTGYVWDDEFYLQNGTETTRLFLTGTAADPAGGTVKTFVTSSSDYTQIKWYENSSTVDPTKIYDGSDSAYQPSFFEVTNSDGMIYRYGDYKSAGSIFAIKGVNPYQDVSVDGAPASGADLLGGAKSQQLCRDIAVNKADSCNFLAVEMGVKWNAWTGPSINAGTVENDGADSGQDYLETAWSLTEIESPLNGLATTLSYVCETQQVGRRLESADNSYVDATGGSGNWYTNSCYPYQIAAADGRFLSLNYLSSTSQVEATQLSTNSTCDDSYGGSVNQPNTAEWFDNQQTDPEPDAYQEHYRVFRLRGVDSYDAATRGNPRHLLNSTIEYCALGEIGDEMMKPVPVRITQTNYAGSEIQISPSSLYSYYNEQDGVAITGDPGDFYSNGALYGALKSISDQSGAVAYLTYQRNDLSSVSNPSSPIDQILYVAADSSVDGISIPTSNRVPFWGPNYMVLAGEGTGDTGSTKGQTVTKFAIFDFGPQGWHLTKVVEAQTAAPADMMKGDAVVTASAYSGLVRLGDDFIAFLSPVKSSLSDTSYSCATLNVLYRQRDAEGTADVWVPAQDGNGQSDFSTALDGTAIQTYCAPTLSAEYWSGAENDVSSDSAKQLPSLDVHDGMIFLGGIGEEVFTTSPNLAAVAWYTRDGGKTFTNSLAYTPVQNFSSNRPFLAAAGPGYGVVYTTSASQSSSTVGLYASYFGFDAGGNAYPAASPTTEVTFNGICCNTQQSLNKFVPKKLMASNIGGFPVVTIRGSYQFPVMKEAADELNNGDRTSYGEYMAWLTFDEASDPSEVGSLTILKHHPTLSNPDVSSGGTKQLDDYSFQYSAVLSSDQDTLAAGNYAIGPAGALWAGFAGLAYGGKGTSTAVFSCGFAAPQYDTTSTPPAWTMATSQLLNGPGYLNEFNVTNGANTTSNSCVAGNWNSDYPDNAATGAAGGSEGVFTTTGNLLSTNFWSYGPVTASNQGIVDTLPALAAIKIEETASASTPSTISEDATKESKSYQLVSEIIFAVSLVAGVLAAPLTGGASLMMLMAGTYISLGMYVWGSSINSAGYSLKAGANAPSMFGIGRYFLDGAQVWFVPSIPPTDLDNTASGLDPVNITPTAANGDLVELTSQLSGTLYGYAVLNVTNTNTKQQDLVYTSVRNAATMGAKEGDYNYETIPINGKAANATNWLNTRGTPAQSTASATCATVDCASLVNQGAFLVYEANGSDPFYSSGKDFQLVQIVKDSVTHIYDYTVAKIEVAGGVTSQTIGYDYGTATYDRTGDRNYIKYADFAGETAFYNNVKVMFGPEAPAIAATSSTEPPYAAYTDNYYVTYNADPAAAVPDVAYRTNASGDPQSTSYTNMLGQLRKLAYRSQKVRLNTGSELANSTTTIVESNSVELVPRPGRAPAGR